MPVREQVDILISKIQVLQILYLNNVYINLIIMDKKLNEIHKNLINTKLTTIL